MYLPPLQGLWTVFRAAVSGRTAPGTKSGFHLVGRCLRYVAKWCFIANYQCKLHQRPPRIFPENMAALQNSCETSLPSCPCSGYKLPVLCCCHVLLVSLFPVILGECFTSMCLQSDCICFPAGKLGCRQAILPRPRRNS